MNPVADPTHNKSNSNLRGTAPEPGLTRQVKWALRALLPCRARPGSFSPEEHTVRRQAQHSGEISGVSRHTSAAANVIPLAGQTPPRVAVRHFIQTIVGERRSRADLPRLEPDPCPTPQMHYLSGGRGCATG
jgi:hypothetical protein